MLWQSNFEFIQKHNREASQNKTQSYLLKINQFADMTPEEFSLKYLNRNNRSNQSFKKIRVLATNVPKTTPTTTKTTSSSKTSPTTTQTTTSSKTTPTTTKTATAKTTTSSKTSPTTIKTTTSPPITTYSTKIITKQLVQNRSRSLKHMFKSLKSRTVTSLAHQTHTNR